MSIQDFDNLTAALADRSISRRRALKMAAASELGAAGLGIAAGEAHATHNECPRRGVGCCRNCTHTGNKVCICVRRISDGRRVCVHQCCPETGPAGGIGAGTECDANTDCPENEICIRRGSCDRCADPASNLGGVCMRRCAAAAVPNAECEQFRC